MQVQLAAAGLQLSEEAHQALQRLAKPIHRPSRNHIDLTPHDAASISSRS
jgi:hypothetical protein